MKTPLRFLWIAAAVVCIACGGGVQNYIVGTGAELTGLSIGDIVIESIPEPIDDFDWEDEEGFNLIGADVAVAPLQRSTDTESVRFKPTVSKGARVVWGIGSQDMRPFEFKDVRVNATFENADYIYFKITSEDAETTNYYRFAIWVRSPVVDLAEVYIGEYITHTETSETGTIVTVVDKDERMMATKSPGNPNLQTAIASTGMGVLSIKTNQSSQAQIKVVPFDTNATLKYGVAATSSETPALGTSNIFNLTDFTFLYIEVTAENTVDTAYYKYRVEVGRIATIKTLTFTKTGAEYGIANLGTQNSGWGSVALGNFETADMPDEGFGVKYELDDPASTVSYVLIANKAADLPAAFTSPAKVVFNGSNVLALKVVSENGRATRYYKIEVVLLAAAFTVQPKSDYYYYYNPDTMVGNTGDQVTWYDYARLTVDDDHANFSAANGRKGTGSNPELVTALTFTLDRAGSFTYQWYEANSWYGGYGFDADGRILYYPSGNPQAVVETGFVGDSYHVEGFDEKKNVSFHNGGNQFYRLENPGRPISGATSATYQPNINRRPFIDGFTSETHYYWVVVTDTAQRKAVSKRAAIVSERDPTKKHHIVNLNEDLHIGNPGDSGYEKGTARNSKVFTRQRETYKIPVTFPAGFNVNDYTVSIVQALFWLRDGTPWIQNWTQGDVGFETADGSQLIYYNLTNNNATLGLVGGGKEPGGGSLTATPKYLIVKPAGEKPVTELPPFKEDGVTPEPNDNAQGWFCGFIELVEVRFEGPAR